jgi:putative photosynthetic complex assembly protein
MIQPHATPHPLAHTAGRTSRGVVLGAGLLIGFVVVAITVGRVEHVGLTRMEPSRPVQSLALRVDDAADGSITLRDAEHGDLVATVQPGADNFIRATLRGFAQGRLRAGLPREVPFRLTRFDDGSLRLDDALTGRSVDFGAFGPSNFAAFARLMPDHGAAR